MKDITRQPGALPILSRMFHTGTYDSGSRRFRNPEERVWKSKGTL